MRAAWIFLVLGVLAGCANEGGKEALIEDRTGQPFKTGPKAADASKPIPTKGPVALADTRPAPGLSVPEAGGQVETRPLPALDVKAKPIAHADNMMGMAVRNQVALDGKPIQLVIQDTHGGPVPCRVEFDYQSAAIQDVFNKVLVKCADVIRMKPDIMVILQGHTDERGSREYNLALGQMRAESVFKALEVLGVPERQMEPVSLGEERPAADGHDEQAWALNRRVEFFLKTGEDLPAVP